jgi:hypothetical protein
MQVLLQAEVGHNLSEVSLDVLAVSLLFCYSLHELKSTLPDEHHTVGWHLQEIMTIGFIPTEHNRGITGNTDN